MAALTTTTLATPTTCPICGFDMTLLQIIQVETHMISHLVVFVVLRSTAAKADTSADW